jgi:hypothetical protein
MKTCVTSIDRGQHLRAFDGLSFRVADCDIDQCLMFAKVRERLTVSKRAAQKVVIERFSLKKINEVEDKQQYQFKISNIFAALKILDDYGDINRAWKLLERTSKFEPQRV